MEKFWDRLVAGIVLLIVVVAVIGALGQFVTMYKVQLIIALAVMASAGIAFIVVRARLRARRGPGPGGGTGGNIFHGGTHHHHYP